MTSRPSPDTPCARCGHPYHEGKCLYSPYDTEQGECPCTEYVAPATHDPESEPRHHPFAKDQEGVRCKRCHRWHSGFTDADAPTDLCEDCAAAPDTAPHVHECAILAHDCSALSPYCRCVCGAEFLWDEWTMPNEWTVTRLYSALENYGRHHNWCAWKKGEICDCGLSDILNERERGPKANARLPEGSPRGVRNPVESRAEKTAVLSPVAPDTAPHEHVCDEGRNNHSGRCTCGCGAKLIGETWSLPSTEPAVSGEAPKCERCHGYGFVTLSGIECPVCKGTGLAEPAPDDWEGVSDYRTMLRDAATGAPPKDEARTRLCDKCEEPTTNEPDASSGMILCGSDHQAAQKLTKQEVFDNLMRVRLDLIRETGFQKALLDQQEAEIASLRESWEGTKRWASAVEHSHRETNTEISRLRAENERLRSFAEYALGQYSWGWNIPDGGSMQDKAEALGLIVEVPADEAFREEYDSDTMFAVAWSDAARRIAGGEEPPKESSLSLQDLREGYV